MTALDAIRWIDSSWKDVTESIVKNSFRTAGFVHPSSTIYLSIIKSPDVAIEADPELNNSYDPLKQFVSVLVHVRIGSHQLTAVKYVGIYSSIPTFNEWDDDEHLKSMIQVEDEKKENDEHVSVTGKPRNLPE
ncbi:unnamed protein product, partial [Rotaria sp. Silwood2]